MTTLPVVHHPAYEVDIGPHVFPTVKYRLVRNRLLQDGVIAESDIVEPRPVSDADVRLAHSAEYVRKIRLGALSIGEQIALEVPFSPALREAMWLCAGGTHLAGRLALERSIAFHVGGGFHHAFPDHGEGFCLINDIAVAIRMLRRDGAIERALVVDCDVHHGNGTAAIFRDDPAVFTLSVHQEHNYPATKPPSDFDLGLEDHTGDAEYLRLLDQHLPGIVGRHAPDLAFYLAGADPYGQDQLGGLALTKAGLRKRDESVIRTLRQAGVPVAIVLAGGYAQRQADTVEIHAATAVVAAAIVGNRPTI